MYNTKLKHYADGSTQTIVYSSPIHIGKKSEPSIPDFERCPFTNDFARVIQPDMEDYLKHDALNKKRSLRRAINTVYDISRANKWDWFVTLTFDPVKVDSFNYSEVTKKLSNWIDRIRKECDENFRYIVVPELHKSGRIHFHGLFANASALSFVGSGYYTKSGLLIYNIGRYSLGWSTATAVNDQLAVTKYIGKYITKDLLDATPGKRHYWASKNCNKPIEETFFLSDEDKAVLHNELLEDTTYFKQIEYEIGFDAHQIKYYESQGLTVCIETGALAGTVPTLLS